MHPLLPPVIFTAVGVIVAWWGLWCALDKSVKPRLLESSTARQLLAGSEVVVAVLISLIATSFDLYKSSAWQTPDLGLVVAAGLVIFLIGAYIAVKAVIQWNKDQDGKTVGTLRTSLETSGAENKLLTSQRDVLRRALTLADEMVEKKLHRIRSCLETTPANLDTFVRSVNPLRQIDVMLTALHHLCEHALNLEPGRKIRLGVYMQVEGHLKPVFSFDGQSVDCFSQESRSCMLISDPEGAKSEITRLFHSQERSHIIPDCMEAQREGQFIFLRPQQQNYLRSLAVVKKTIRNIHGVKEVMILALDADQPSFFKQSDKTDIELCCDTVMKRLEFELLWLEIIQSTAPHPP